ncbi:TPA: hypothetical protein ACXIV4_003975 [Enterobacter hormaechei]|nr:hypothetical protein Y59_37360 [Enterobacter hormaechei]
MGDCAALFAGWRFAYPAYETTEWKEGVGRVSEAPPGGFSEEDKLSEGVRHA